MNILDVVLSLIVTTAVCAGALTVVRESLHMQTQALDVSAANQCAASAASDWLTGSNAAKDVACSVVISSDDSNGWVEIDADTGRAKEVLQLPEDSALN